MTKAFQINTQLVTQSRLDQTDYNNLGFGKVFSDHMLVCDFKDGAWEKPQIIPFQNLSISPATNFIHYGQSIFEGLKAFLSTDGKVRIFRPEANARRMNISAKRLCMPEIPEEIFLEGLNELLNLDKKWIPTSEGSSMYIRPFMFSLDAEIRVRPSDTYRFMIILSPSGKYYSSPVKVLVERQYVRAARGGLGSAKTSANYAASLYPAKLAQQRGFDQLIWTDASEHQYIEEAGTMNFMFVINDTLITPALSDSILAGITRDSIITLAKEWGMKVEERNVSIDEVLKASENGTLKEAFGAGTAAVVSPIVVIHDNGKDYNLPAVEGRIFSARVAKELSEIKAGTKADSHNWVTVL
ncbi:MAG: branched-chain amino acid aminotransferase [Opitutaceae bacterium]|nr:branched-chain amino acid aminotransferase [Cytophagales bacterium]